MLWCQHVLSAANNSRALPLCLGVEPTLRATSSSSNTTERPSTQSDAGWEVHLQLVVVENWVPQQQTSVRHPMNSQQNKTQLWLSYNARVVMSYVVRGWFDRRVNLRQITTDLKSSTLTEFPWKLGRFLK